MKQMNYFIFTFFFLDILSVANASWIYKIDLKKETLLRESPCSYRTLNPHLGGDIVSSSCALDLLATQKEVNDVWIFLNSSLTPSPIPNDPLLNDQWYIDAVGLTIYWKKHNAGNKNIKIAVIDTGVNYLHEDLIQNLSINPNEIPNNLIDDDHNGYIDDYLGWDASKNNGDPMAIFDHGTHVTGIIGATSNNQLGIVGVNWMSEIIPIKFVDERGSGSTESAIVAIDYAVARGAKIINASWSGKKLSPLLAEMISRLKDKGVLFVAAAGNDSNDNDLSPTYPASFDFDNIISVASHDLSGDLSTFSNYGKKSVDISAPGESIISTIATQRYGFNSGTSMAAPIITGIVSLLWSEHLDWNYLQVKNELLKNCKKDNSSQLACGGRVYLKD